jgi:hypothetical protein
MSQLACVLSSQTELGEVPAVSHSMVGDSVTLVKDELSHGLQLSHSQKRHKISELPIPSAHEEKVIDSKTICYCSNFDININDWFNQYENIEIFKINIKKNLGKEHLVFLSNFIGTMWL